MFRDQLQRLAGPDVRLVDSAETTAAVVAKALGPVALGASSASRVLLATDDVARFKRVGRHFLGQALGDVELVDL